jgi:hypothetical protein
MLPDLRLLPSGTWRRVVWHIGTNILKKKHCCLKLYSENGGNNFGRNLRATSQTNGALPHTTVIFSKHISEHLAPPKFQEKNR